MLLWLLFTLYQPVNSAEKCDPARNKHWYPVQNEPTKFYYCHPHKKIYELDDCLGEKTFDYSLQQCVQQNNTKQHFGTVPSLHSIGQQLIRSSEHFHVELDEVRCPTGRVPLRKPSTGGNVECSATAGQDNPSLLHCGVDGSYRCSFLSQKADKGICCETLNIDLVKCPEKMKAMTEKDGSVRACSPRQIGSCRGIGSVCVFDEEQGDFHCCDPDPSEYEDIDDVEASTANYLSIGVSSQMRPPKYVGHRRFSKDGEDVISGCRAGEAPFFQPNSRSPMDCKIDKLNTCPPGYQCYRSRRYQRYQCCGFNSGYCPANSAALIGPKNKKVTCGTLSGCPENFFCYKPTHTCCSLDPSEAICEVGQPFFSLNGRAKRCEDGPCPNGYQCTTRFNKSVCCPKSEHICTQALNIGLHCLTAKSRKAFYYHAESGECRAFTYSGCSGNDNNFESIKLCEEQCHETKICYIGSALKMPSGHYVSCTDSSPCPSDEYECHSTNRGRFCCPKIETLDICPEDSTVFIQQSRPVECYFSKECPSGYECHRPNYHNVGFCCLISLPQTKPSPIKLFPKTSKAPIYYSKCSDGQLPLVAPDNETQVCIPNKELECPNGFQCELDSFLGRYQCCPSSLSTPKLIDCPSGFSVQLNRGTNQPVKCDPQFGRKSCNQFGQCHHSSHYSFDICCIPDSLEGLLKIEKDAGGPGIWSGIIPGGHGCISDNQCHITFPGAWCNNGECRCPKGLKLFESNCEDSCPPGFVEVDGVCTKDTLH